MRVPRWPLWLWSVQLLPAACLLYFGIWRQSTANQIQADQTTTTLILAVGAVWAAVVVGVLALPRPRHWLIFRRREMLLSAVTTLAGLVLMDVALNLLGLMPTIEQQRARSIAYSFGRYTKHRLVAKDILLDDGGSIHVNGRGFRGNEIDPGNKSGRVRIVFLGGSQVFDYHGSDWPALVGDELRTLGYDVEVINAGVPGHTTFDSLGKVVSDVWTLQPDILVLCQAWNDIRYFPSLSPATPYRGLAPKVALSWYRDWRLYPGGIDRLLSYSAIYRQFRWGIGQFLYHGERDPINQPAPNDPNAKAFDEWGPKQYRLNLELMATLAKTIRAELVICKQAHLAVPGGTGADQEAARDYGRRNIGLDQAELMRAFQVTYALDEEVARERGIRILDMDQALSGRKEFFHDGIHFSRAGSRAASNLVAQALLPIVTGRSRPKASN